MHRSVTVDVDVYLSDFDDDDLIDEVQARGYNVTVSVKKMSKLREANLPIPEALLDGDYAGRDIKGKSSLGGFRRDRPIPISDGGAR